MRRHEMNQYGIFKTGREHKPGPKFAVRPGDNSCGISLGDIGRKRGRLGCHAPHDT
jgi:hypothetical protein